MHHLSALSIPSYNLFWIVLLLLTSVESLVALVGTNILQKRHHNILLLANEILATLQLAFLIFFVAIVFNPVFSSQQSLLKASIELMIFVALCGYLLGLKFAAPAHYDKVFKKLKHDCPTSVDEECTKSLGFRTYVRLVGFNLLACAFSLAGGLIILLFLRPAPSVTAAVVRLEPQGTPAIRPVPYKGQPDWYSDHSFWLEQEGDRDKRQGIATAYELGEASYTTASATYKFAVVLRVPDKYVIASQAAFRVTTLGSREFFERLEPLPEDSLRGVRVSVPECNKGDRVNVLFRVESTLAGAPIDVADIVKATLQ
jgi:hypothetical protein